MTKLKIAFILALFFIPGYALAADEDGCLSKDPDISIDACTAHINSRDQHGTDLAASYTNRGNAFSNKGFFDNAIADYGHAIALDPTYVLAFYNRGDAYLKMGQYKNAISDESEAIIIKPGFVQAENDRGLAYYAEGAYDQALDDFSRSLNSIQDARIYVNRGNCYAKMLKYSLAIADYTKAISVSPNFALAYVNRGTAFAKEGMRDKAVQDYRSALTIDPSLTAVNAAIRHLEVPESNPARDRVG